MVWRFDHWKSPQYGREQQALRNHMHCMLQSRSHRFPGLFLLTDIQQLHSHLSWRDDNSGWKTTNLAALNCWTLNPTKSEIIPKSCSHWQPNMQPRYWSPCHQVQSVSSILSILTPQDLEVCAECALALWNKIPVATKKDCQDSNGRTCRCPQS